MMKLSTNIDLYIYLCISDLSHNKCFNGHTMKAQLQITGELYKVISILCYCKTFVDCVFLCAHCNVALTFCYTFNRSVIIFDIFCQFCPLSFGTIRRIGLGPVLMLRCVWTASPRRRRNVTTHTHPSGSSRSLCEFAVTSALCL